MSIKKTLATILAVGVLAFNFATSAFAATGYSLEGDATVVTGGNPGNAVKLTSDADPGYGLISFNVAPGTTFADLETLTTDFMVESDDLCVGGSPRFSIGIDTNGDGTRDGSIWSYLGPDSGGAACTPGVWQNSGDQLQTGRTVDSSQLTAGQQVNPYDAALAQYGSFAVTHLTLVVDAGWADSNDSEQTVLVDNTSVNGTSFSYEANTPANKDQCKKNGWRSLEDANGNTFKNQGQCVSYFNHQ